MHGVHVGLSSVTVHQWVIYVCYQSTSISTPVRSNRKPDHWKEPQLDRCLPVPSTKSDRISAPPVTKIINAILHSKAAFTGNILNFAWFGVVAKVPNVERSCAKPRRQTDRPQISAQALLSTSLSHSALQRRIVYCLVRRTKYVDQIPTVIGIKSLKLRRLRSSAPSSWSVPGITGLGRLKYSLATNWRREVVSCTVDRVQAGGWSVTALSAYSTLVAPGSLVKTVNMEKKKNFRVVST
jgi:hypothetical protein